MSTVIQKSAVGQRLRVSLLVDSAAADLTGFSACVFAFLPPSLTRFERTGSVADVAGGLVEYAFVGGDLTEIGNWKVQVRIEFLDGSVFRSSVGKFKVKDNV